MHRRRSRAVGRLALLASAAALAAASPAVAQDFPLYGEDKFLGSVNEFNHPLFLQYFNQVTPENAGKWGSAAGTSRTAPMRWQNLDTIYNFAQENDLPFNFHVLVWGNQQPTWMAQLPPEEQLLEIHKWFAAVAERYPNIEWLQVVNEPLHDPPDCTPPFNQGAACNQSGNYARALGGSNGTDGTGWDWILNAFRLAKQYFPNTKLMINDYSITNNDADTGRYLQIINLLKEEDLIDVIGVQGHAFSTTGNMAQHKANLDRLAATGLPIQVTELDIDGQPSGGVPGEVVQLNNYRRIVPTFWEHPAVEGITVWGWRQPNHWRNAQNAPIVLSNGTPKPAAMWLYNYVRGIAPEITEDQSFTLTDTSVANRVVGTVEATDWASEMGRPELRTFTWRITDGNDDGIFSIEPSTGVIRVAKPELVREHTTYTLTVDVNDGFHTSDEVDVDVVVGDLTNVASTDVGAQVPATLALLLDGNAGFGSFVPGVAALSVVDPSANAPGHLVNGTFSLAQPLQAAVSGDFAAVSGTPLTLHTYDGPVSNDVLTVRFKQSIGATEPLRTGTYAKTLTFTLSTTTP
jgi:GH35 family endo-1,4-beta-xylanase